MAKKLPKLGSGKRFSNLEHSLAGNGVRNPAALAAWIGDKKYGHNKMHELATSARKRRAHKG